MPEDFSESRRKFLGYAIGGAAAAVTLAYAVPLASYLIKPALKKEEAGWSKVGLIDEVGVGSPVSMTFSAHTKIGWQEKAVERDVWVVKKRDATVEVFSPTCPHLGCGYRWNQANNRFECPCHSSTFSIDGKALGGPAPRNLDTLPSKVEDGALYVRFEKFRLGITEKVEA
ncbi:MAG TPA: ubiquinol-cytochrome c reductase iron-sulfur subunit [Nitrospirota bacterium]